MKWAGGKVNDLKAFFPTNTQQQQQRNTKISSPNSLVFLNKEFIAMQIFKNRVIFKSILNYLCASFLWRNSNEQEFSTAWRSRVTFTKLQLLRNGVIYFWAISLCHHQGQTLGYSKFQSKFLCRFKYLGKWLNRSGRVMVNLRSANRETRV